jgi:hypothetical protein
MGKEKRSRKIGRDEILAGSERKCQARLTNSAHFYPISIFSSPSLLSPSFLHHQPSPSSAVLMSLAPL